MRKLPMLDRRRLTIAGIVLAVILFVALNTFGSLALRGERLDLTDNRQFTLSPGTLQLLARIDEPITLRFYASRALRDANPFLGSYADRVHDMLHTYADAARGRITVEYIDPEPFSTEEDHCQHDEEAVVGDRHEEVASPDREGAATPHDRRGSHRLDARSGHRAPP